MVETITKDLDLGEHQTGYEWLAGRTPPRDRAPGKWIARKNQLAWAVIFRSFSGAEYVIQTFPLTDGGERVAKVMAQKLVQISWGYEYKPQF
jgi:hypothetical protein